MESAATIRTKVFVWGLNDKDQLGGLKGSKVSHVKTHLHPYVHVGSVGIKPFPFLFQIKVPSFSETLSALNVVQVSGGSKSLFAGKNSSDCVEKSVGCVVLFLINNF